MYPSAFVRTYPRKCSTSRCPDFQMGWHATGYPDIAETHKTDTNLTCIWHTVMTLIAQEVRLSWQTHARTLRPNAYPVQLQVGYCLQQLHKDVSEQQVELASTFQQKCVTWILLTYQQPFLGPNCALSPCGCKLGRSGPCSCVRDSVDGEWTSQEMKFNIETLNHIFENTTKFLALLLLRPREMLDC